MNMNAPKGRIAQLVDKVDILRAQIAGMRALATEVGSDPDTAIKPYVDLLLDLLDADLADALLECRPTRVVTGSASTPEASGGDGKRVEIEGTMRSCDLDIRRFILRDGGGTVAVFHFSEALEADVMAHLGRRVRVSCRALSVDVPRTAYIVESIAAP
jgi:hypothetical protein